MTFKEYQREVIKLALYKDKDYPFVGLSAEAGEVMGKLAKMLRGDYGRTQFITQVLPELGDCLWMITAACNELNLSLETLAENNIKKLKDRQKRGVLKGDGDNR